MHASCDTAVYEFEHVAYFIVGGFFTVERSITPGSQHRPRASRRKLHKREGPTRYPKVNPTQLSSGNLMAKLSSHNWVG
jgi:hypothetical protein